MLLFKIFLFVFSLSSLVVPPKIPPCLLHIFDNRTWSVIFIAHLYVYTGSVHCTDAYLHVYTQMERAFLLFKKNGIIKHSVLNLVLLHNSHGTLPKSVNTALSHPFWWLWCGWTRIYLTIPLSDIYLSSTFLSLWTMLTQILMSLQFSKDFFFKEQF